MAFPRTILLAAALLALVACRSDPIQFHTLTPIQPIGAVQVDETEVTIEVVNVPPQVDRQQIVIRQSDSSLAILENHWWGASLTEELRSALSQQLPNNSAGRRVSVRLDVLRLDSIPGQYALIDVRWRLRDFGDEANTMMHCRSTLQTAAGANIDDVVIAHQNNLQRLAEQISDAANNVAGKCP
ncbi:hypothetical protein CH92_09595 [Stutzerimonas stutzeri]|uniref:ABC-type transport auxiliary lipoprotein component domain-containing protein n=1 Tax=Stutzerimonas stutzeri TaxID=316 RepID=W8RAA6_STUST|nr:PqiC family protein [Stutzerimonas stutzeri]AHL75352.1 hypothetical protein CH92_09595 [Stutzerimonas stutzeri]MCQ4328094.1 PqiC family protein [Stutzerimonas stutzeri]